MKRKGHAAKLEIADLKSTWDDSKALANIRSHGITFEEAATCWLDPFKMEVRDSEHSIVEPRWLLIGLSKLNRLLVCWFTERKLGRFEAIRLIGARKPSAKERTRYEEATR